MSNERLTIALERPDTPTSRALQSAFFAEVARLYPGYNPQCAPSARDDEVTPPHGAWLVAYLDGGAVGCGAIKRLGETTAEVKRLYVDRTRAAAASDATCSRRSKTRLAKAGWCGRASTPAPISRSR